MQSVNVDEDLWQLSLYGYRNIAMRLIMVAPTVLIAKYLQMEYVLVMTIIGLYVIVYLPGVIHCETRIRCYLKTNAVILLIMALMVSFSRITFFHQRQTIIFFTGVVQLFISTEKDIFGSTQPILWVLTVVGIGNTIWTGHAFLLQLLFGIHYLEKKEAVYSGVNSKLRTARRR